MLGALVQLYHGVEKLLEPLLGESFLFQDVHCLC